MRLTRLATLVALAGLAAPAFAADPPARRFAILVGVNKYEHDKLPPLKYAVADVTALADVLKRHGYTVALLTDETPDKPTRTAIEAKLKGVLEGCRKGDTVVVAFAGHGVQFQGQRDAYFCPVDARPFADRADSLVSLSTMYTNLEHSFAGVKVLLVDACRDDPSGSRAASRGVDADAAPRPPRGVAALFSCSAGERAFEHDDLRHGVFFHYVLEGLGGHAKDADGEITFNGLAGFVSKRVARDIPTRLGGGARQSPNLKADLSGEAPVLVGAAVAVSVEPKRGNNPFTDPAVSKPDLRTTAPADFETGLKFLYGRGGERVDYRRAFTLFHAAADGGHSDAMYFLGMCYDDGLGAKLDPQAAVKWYRRASEAGNPRAAFALAMLYHKGSGVERDEAEAQRLAAPALAKVRAVAESGDPDAQNSMGVGLSVGLGVKADLDQALVWYTKASKAGYPTATVQLGMLKGERGADAGEVAELVREAAEAGLPAAMTNLGIRYQFGQGVKQDQAEARRWYEKAVAVNDMDAHACLGMAFRDGRGGRKDVAEAVRLLKIAADGGSLDGMANLAGLYLHGVGLPADDQQALYWTRKAADAGSIVGQYNLGWLHQFGRGVKVNYAEAAKWYEKSAEAGYADGMNDFGFLLVRGAGVRQDYDAAMKWFQKAAEYGNTTALDNIGAMHQQGLGVEKDDDEAAKWYRKSAEAGNPLGMNDLGFMYQKGWGVGQDHGEAVKWYKKSADLGNALGMNNLGFMYQNGWGVRQNHQEAARLYLLSAKAGNAMGKLNYAFMVENGYGVERDPATAKLWYQQAADSDNDEVVKEARTALKRLR